MQTPTTAGDAPPVTIVPVPVPASLADPEAWAIHEIGQVEDAIANEIYGHTDLAYTAAENWSALVYQEYRQVHRFVAVRDDAQTPNAQTPDAQTPESVVGHAMVALPQVGNRHTAWVTVGVQPEWRRRGIGAALWRAALDVVTGTGRPVVQAYSAYAVEPPPGPGALEPPTGSGRIPVDDHATRFATGRGFALEQVERHSVLDLPVPPERLAELRQGAVDAAGPDYRVHVWDDEIPEQWLDGFAELETRMSTDVPVGGLDVTEDAWDAARVRASEVEIHDRGHRFLVAVAEHAPTGALAAFSMVTYPVDKPQVVFQEDTLVRRDHRGHRLGLLVKSALYAALTELRPTAQRIHTWNAEENAHMLAINVALGFRPASVEALWQLRLTTAADPDADVEADGQPATASASASVNAPA